MFEILTLSITPGNPVDVINRAEDILKSGRVDWNELYRLATLHAIRPQVHDLLQKLSPGNIPRDSGSVFRDYTRLNLFNQLRFFHKFLEIRDLLFKENIEILPFKGFSLAALTRGNIAFREAGDVDVFARISDLQGIREAMLSNGYSPEPKYHNRSLEEILEKDQEYSFERLEGGRCIFHIEFHWGICPPDYGMNIRFEDLVTQSGPLTVQDVKFTGLTPAAQFLLAILHHGGNDKFTKLKYIDDIAYLLHDRDDLDWDWINWESKRFHAEKLVYTGVKLASVLGGIKIPSMIYKEVTAKSIEKLAIERINVLKNLGQPRNRFLYNFNNWRFRMRSRTGIRQNIKSTMATLRFVLSGEKAAN